MSRIAFCEACSMQKHGAKTRIALEHTCGLETGAINPDISYRGPDSHCKACEDERAGIKGVMSFNHTCSKFFKK